MNKTKDQISGVSSHDLYWENKMYKRKRSIVNTRLMNVFRTSRFLNVTFISECKNDSNTHRFAMNKNTFIDNESFNNYEI